jgi:hypothetical protein
VSIIPFKYSALVRHPNIDIKRNKNGIRSTQPGQPLSNPRSLSDSFHRKIHQMNPVLSVDKGAAGLSPTQTSSDVQPLQLTLLSISNSKSSAQVHAPQSNRLDPTNVLLHILLLKPSFRAHPVLLVFYVVSFLGLLFGFCSLTVITIKSYDINNCVWIQLLVTTASYRIGYQRLQYPGSSGELHVYSHSTSECLWFLFSVAVIAMPTFACVGAFYGSSFLSDSNTDSIVILLLTDFYYLWLGCMGIGIIMLFISIDTEWACHQLQDLVTATDIERIGIDDVCAVRQNIDKLVQKSWYSMCFVLLVALLFSAYFIYKIYCVPLSSNSAGEAVCIIVYWSLFFLKEAVFFSFVVWKTTKVNEMADKLLLKLGQSRWKANNDKRIDTYVYLHSKLISFPVLGLRFTKKIVWFQVASYSLGVIAAIVNGFLESKHI